MDDLVGKEILLGTYEAFVLGYKVTEDKKELVITSKYLIFAHYISKILGMIFNINRSTITGAFLLLKIKEKESTVVKLF